MFSYITIIHVIYESIKGRACENVKVNRIKKWITIKQHKLFIKNKQFHFEYDERRIQSFHPNKPEASFQSSGKHKNHKKFFLFYAILRQQQREASAFINRKGNEINSKLESVFFFHLLLLRWQRRSRRN